MRTLRGEYDFESRSGFHRGLLVSACLAAFLSVSFHTGLQAVVEQDEELGETAQSLDEETIRSLYASFMEGRLGVYEDEGGLQIERCEGSFTGAGATEAVASVKDFSVSHAEGYYKLFLLSFGEEWKIESLLANGDYGSFQAVDLDGDGKLEVWYTWGGGNQGYFVTYGKLVTVTPEGEDVIYSNEGFDFRGALRDREGITARENETRFEDLDGDGMLEIVNVETVYLKRSD